jgi:hypothetical protein
MTTLADIVNSALSSSEGSLKLASARDAVPVEGSSIAFLDEELTLPKSASDDESDDDHRPPPKRDEKKDKDEPEKKAAHNEIVSDAEYAMKLAEALTLGSDVVSAKLAEGHSAMDAPGPQIHQSEFHTTPTTSPKAHSKVTPTISGPSTQGPAGLPTTKSDFTSTGDQSGRAKNHPGKTAGDEAWTKSKEASIRVMRAKVAQAETLLSLGHVGAAEQLLAEVQRAQEKIAQDPSSPQPVMGAQTTNPGALDTEPGPATHVPDNAGMASLTKAQARDKTTREASQYISETPKKDNAVAAHTLRTDGQKLSHLVLPGVRKTAAEQPEVTPPAAPPATTKQASLDPEVGRAYLAKLIKTASNPEATDAQREKAASALKSIKAKIGIDPETLLS